MVLANAASVAAAAGDSARRAVVGYTASTAMDVTCFASALEVDQEVAQAAAWMRKMLRDTQTWLAGYKELRNERWVEVEVRRGRWDAAMTTSGWATATV